MGSWFSKTVKEFHALNATRNPATKELRTLKSSQTPATVPHQRFPPNPPSTPCLLGLPIELRKRILSEIFPKLLFTQKDDNVLSVIFRQKHKDFAALFTNKQLSQEALSVLQTNALFVRRAIRQFGEVTGHKPAVWINNVTTFEVEVRMPRGAEAVRVNVDEEECGLKRGIVVKAVTRAALFFFGPEDLDE